MGFFLSLLVTLATSYVIGGLLAQFPKDVAPDDSDPFGAPQSKPSSPVPLVFGTRRIKGVNVLWYGRVSNKSIKQKVKSGFKKKKVTVGYQYYLAMQLGICYGFSNLVLKSLFIGDDEIVSFDTVSGGITFFDKSKLYGGYKQGGGIRGAVRFFNGIDAMGVSPVLYNATINNRDQLPHYNNIATASLSWSDEIKGMYIGTSKQIRPVSFTISNIDFFIQGSGQPYTNGLDVNPVSFLRYLLMDDLRFSKLTSTDIDTGSFDTAEAQIWTEGLFFSPIFSQTKTIEKMSEVVLKFIDAVLYSDPLTGKLTLKLLRAVVETGLEPVLDSSNIKRIIKTKLPETTKRVNEVKLTYTDRGHDYLDRTITSQDLASFIEAGSVHNTKTINFPSICDTNIARIICDRELLQLSTPITTIELECKRVLASSRIGDVVKVDYEPIGIQGDFFRIAEIDYGTLDNNNIKVVLMSDMYTDQLGIYESEFESEFEDPIDVAVTTEITNGLYVELPRRLLYTLGDLQDTLDNSWLLFSVVEQTDLNNYDYDVYVDETNTNAYSVTVGNSNFISKATLTDPYLKTDGVDYYDSANLLRFSIPEGELEAYTEIVTDAQNLAEPERYALINNEWILYTDVTDLGGGVYSLESVYRGIFDSIPSDHSIGDTIYFISDNEDIIAETALLVDANPTIKIKLNPNGITGDLGIENVTHSDTVSTISRASLPLPVGRVKYNSLNATTEDNTIQGDVVITWRHRNKDVLQGVVLQTTSGHTKEANVTYTINIYEADGTTLLRQEIGLTAETYTYTKAFELADKGSYLQAIVVEIISVDSVTGNCLYPRKDLVHKGGYGLNYGNNYGK